MMFMGIIPQFFGVLSSFILDDPVHPLFIQIAEPTRPGDATGLVATDGAAGHSGCDCWGQH